MWRRFEQRKIHRPKGVKQLRQARLKGQPRSSAAVVPEAPGILDFPRSPSESQSGLSHRNSSQAKRLLGG